MLVHELHAAWANARKQVRPDSIVPQRLDGEQTVLLLGLYQRNEFDALCSGGDRHARFAEWAVNNYYNWSLVLVRLHCDHMKAVEVAAQTYPVRTMEAK